MNFLEQLIHGQQLLPHTSVGWFGYVAMKVFGPIVGRGRGKSEMTSNLPPIFLVLLPGMWQLATLWVFFFASLGFEGI